MSCMSKYMYTHTRGISFSYKKEESPAICDCKDELWGHYSELNKSDRERQTLKYVEHKKANSKK